MVALAWKLEASAPAARVRLNAIAASTSQAELAMKLPGGQMRERPVLQVGDDLLDDRVAAVVGLGGEHRQGRVGEHGVVAPGGEQLALRVHGDVVRVGVTDPAHDQPSGDVLCLRAGDERGERHLGDLGVTDPLLSCSSKIARG